jgi:UDP-N-acetylmuramoylalanine--D-glutamate ligase
MNNVLMAETETNRALVVGLGVTGLACVRHLVARGYEVTVVDSRTQPPQLPALHDEFPDVAVHTGGFAANVFARPGLLVVSPGVSLREPSIARALAAGHEAIGDIELFAQSARAPAVAITGSNGKSTVTALVGEMCRASGMDTAIGGNIGIPALSLLREPEPEVYVLELSSFQLESTHSLNAHAAAVLNITPDHLDRYGDVDEYAAAKARIFHGDGAMVLNADDNLVMRMTLPRRRVIRFGLNPPAADDYGLIESKRETWLAKGGRSIMPAGEVPLSGKHNLANALAAMALAECVGVSFEAMREAVRRFKGLPHRMEVVIERDGVRWINDSKGTNVGATVAALNGLSTPVVLIAGGDGKGADFTPLQSACAERARAVVLIGRDAPRIETALISVVPLQHADDMITAVRAARGLARPGDAVLLSPACASFDMYRNYEHRGDVFKAALKEVLG